MAWTQSDLDALDAAIKKGVRSVSYQSGRVDYHSLDDMLKLRALMAGEVNGTSTPSTTVGVYASGLQGSFLYPVRRCR
jgi:hypothetical protein